MCGSCQILMIWKGHVVGYRVQAAGRGRSVGEGG